MAWREVDRVESRRMFICAVESGKFSFAELCRQFGISRKTGYKWLKRYRAEGEAGLIDRSRRPHRVRYATDPGVKHRLIADRHAHPYWGARKLCKRLETSGSDPPPERTANRILKRAALIEPRPSKVEEPKRFQRSRPNDLWQMDHKAAIHGGWFRRAVPLVVVDDCTRYLVGLRSLPDKGLDSTWSALWDVFGDFGLPKAILSDNDHVFHGPSGPSRLEVRLMRLGIDILHGRTYHPQTQGKVERLNGTLELEVLRDGSFQAAAEIQPRFDRFRHDYNFERPHEALDLEVPGARYCPSERPRPDALPDVEYPPGTLLRKGQKDGWISWKGYRISVGVGLRGQRVEVREVQDGIEVYYGPRRILGRSASELTKGRRNTVGPTGKTDLLVGNSATGYALRSVSHEQEL